jgi:N utilization substance protein A
MVNQKPGVRSLNGDLLRLVDSIHRDKDIEKAIIFEALEDALLSAARKHYGPKADIAVFVDRESGQIEAFDGNEAIDAVDIGRIAAQTAKQVIIQKIRDAEHEVIFHDYEERLKQIVSGTIQRFEGSTIVVNLGRTEAILPRSEQVREEDYRIGDRIRCFLLDVKRVGTRVRILLSRSHPDFIRRLFELEVPEISERVIEIMAIAREPGYRTKVAVASADAKVDAVGACVGVRGSRIKNVVAELNDEKIDIVRWSDSRDILIANALKPAEVRDVAVLNEFNRARVTVPEEELSLAIGKRGRNVRLAAKLCEVDIDVLSEAEAERELEEITAALDGIENVPDRFGQRLFQMGYSTEDIAEGASAWVDLFDIDEATCEVIYERSRVAAEEYAARRAEEAEAAAAAEAEAAAAAEAMEEEGVADEAPAEMAAGAETAPHAEDEIAAGIEELMATAAEEEASQLSLEEALLGASAGAAEFEVPAEAQGETSVEEVREESGAPTEEEPGEEPEAGPEPEVAPTETSEASDAAEEEGAKAEPEPEPAEEPEDSEEVSDEGVAPMAEPEPTGGLDPEPTDEGDATGGTGERQEAPAAEPEAIAEVQPGTLDEADTPDERSEQDAAQGPEADQDSGDEEKTET